MPGRKNVNYKDYEIEIKAMYEQVKNFNLTAKDFENSKYSIVEVVSDEDWVKYKTVVSNLKDLSEAFDGIDVKNTDMQKKWEKVCSDIKECQNHFSRMDFFVKENEYESFKEEKNCKLFNFLYNVKDLNRIVDNIGEKELYLQFTEDRADYEANHTSYKNDKDFFLENNKDAKLTKLIADYKKKSEELKKTEKSIEEVRGNLGKAKAETNNAITLVENAKIVRDKLEKEKERYEQAAESFKKANIKFQEIYRESVEFAAKKEKTMQEISEIQLKLEAAKNSGEEKSLAEKLTLQKENLKNTLDKETQYKPFCEQYEKIVMLEMKKIEVQEFAGSVPKDFEKYILSYHSGKYGEIPQLLKGWFEKYENLLSTQNNLLEGRKFNSFEDVINAIDEQKTKQEKELEQIVEANNGKDNFNKETFENIKKVQYSKAITEWAAEKKKSEKKELEDVLESKQKGINYEEQELKKKIRQALLSTAKVAANDLLEENVDVEKWSGSDKLKEIVLHVNKKYNYFNNKLKEKEGEFVKANDKYKKLAFISKGESERSLEQRLNYLNSKKQKLTDETTNMQKMYGDMRSLYTAYIKDRTMRRDLIGKYEEKGLSNDVVTGSQVRANHLKEMLMKQTPEGRKNSTYFDEMKTVLEEIVEGKYTKKEEYKAKLAELKEKAETYKSKKLEQNRPWPSAMRMVRLTLTDAIIGYCNLTEKAVDMVGDEQKKDFQDYIMKTKFLEDKREIGNFNSYISRLEASADSNKLEAQKDPEYKKNKPILDTTEARVRKDDKYIKKAERDNPDDYKYVAYTIDDAAKEI